jgi:hypothetical protein
MARDIDDADKEIVIKMPVGKSEFRCDASFLLFLETIAIDTRECPDQRGLTVIDMPRGAYDYTFHDRLRLYHEWDRRERVEGGEMGEGEPLAKKIGPIGNRTNRTYKTHRTK